MAHEDEMPPPTEPTRRSSSGVPRNLIFRWLLGLVGYLALGFGLNWWEDVRSQFLLMGVLAFIAAPLAVVAGRHVPDRKRWFSYSLIAASFAPMFWWSLSNMESLAIPAAGVLVIAFSIGRLNAIE